MREWQSQFHVRWYCRYHVVWVPKYRKRAIFGEMRRYLPAYVLISQATMHDAKVLGLLRLNAGSIVAMDRAYNDYRQFARWDWENRSGVVSAARRGVGGRARAVGSRACLVGYSTEVECGEHGGVLEREVGDPHSSGVSPV